MWIRLAGEQSIVTEFQCVNSSLDNYCLHSQSEKLHYLTTCEESRTLRLCNIARERNGEYLECSDLTWISKTGIDFFVHGSGSTVMIPSCKFHSS